MGQYYYVCNLDKKQFLYPHKFGDGFKLMEFGCSSDGTLTALAVLLSSGNGRGGGDLNSEHPIIGSWAGDRIVVAGDYADPGQFVPEDLKPALAAFCLDEQLKRKELTRDKAEEYALSNQNLHHCAEWVFEDISDQVIEAMSDDGYVRESLQESLERRRHKAPDDTLCMPATTKIAVFGR